MGPADCGSRSECAPQGSRVHPKGWGKQYYWPLLTEKKLEKSNLQILFPKHLGVVCDVAGDYVGQRAHRERAVTGDSGARPGVSLEVIEERYRPQTDRFELVNQLSPGSCICLGYLNRKFLIETRKRVLEPTREPERAAQEKSLTVIDVIQDFPDGPLSRSISLQTLLFGNALQKLKSFAELRLNSPNDVFTGDKVNVFEIVGSGFGGLWSCHLAEIVAKFWHFRNQPCRSGVYLRFTGVIEILGLKTGQKQGVKKMKKRKNYSISQFAVGILVTLLLSIVPAVALANPVQGALDPQLARRVRRELVTLPYYGVFDNLGYSINAGTVTLYGQVVRPTTRSDAEGRIKRLPGVTRVVNNIRVLPLSRFDDNIRVATYRSIARTAGLYRYLQGTNPSLHIVVDRGHVTLEGVVSSSADRTLANHAASRVSGVFSVRNNLRLEGEEPR